MQQQMAAQEAGRGSGTTPPSAGRPRSCRAGGSPGAARSCRPSRPSRPASPARSAAAATTRRARAASSRARRRSSGRSAPRASWDGGPRPRTRCLGSSTSATPVNMRCDVGQSDAPRADRRDRPCGFRRAAPIRARRSGSSPSAGSCPTGNVRQLVRLGLHARARAARACARPRGCGARSRRCVRSRAPRAPLRSAGACRGTRAPSPGTPRRSRSA